MPFQRERYPVNWEEISRRIRFERAGGRCEHCGAAHLSTILRSTLDAGRYLVFDVETTAHTDPRTGQAVRLSELPDEFAGGKYTTVILTTHHVGAPKPDGSPGDVQDKMDCRDENLLALCQRCHFIADLPYHLVSAQIARRANRRRRVLDAGQMELF